MLYVGENGRGPYDHSEVLKHLQGRHIHLKLPLWLNKREKLLFSIFG